MQGLAVTTVHTPHLHLYKAFEQMCFSLAAFFVASAFGFASQFVRILIVLLRTVNTNSQHHLWLEGLLLTSLHT